MNDQKPNLIIRKDPNHTQKWKFQTENYFGEYKWKALSMDDNSQQIDQWHLQKFFLDKCGSPVILDSIRNIGFPYLLEIYLWGNKIESLESFSRMKMPQIQRVCIGNNRIVNINEFRKSCFTNLQTLYINSNPIKQISTFHELAAQNLKTIRLQLYTDKCWNSDIEWFAKINTASLKSIDMLSTSRIINKERMQCFKRKHTDGNINFHRR